MIAQLRAEQDLMIEEIKEENKLEFDDGKYITMRSHFILNFSVFSQKKIRSEISRRSVANF